MIDITSVAKGEIIPLGEIKTIQHLEGGIIEKILVEESEEVKKDQSLVILAPTASQVEVDELQVRMDSQIIKSIRLEAEINNFETPVFSEDLINVRPDIIQKSMELFQSRKKKYDGEISEVNTLINQSQTDVDILLRKTEMSAQLLEEKVTNEFAHLNVLKELNTAKGRLEELIEKKTNVSNFWIEESRDELQLAQREISQSNETMKELRDNLERTIIKAPVDGFVKNLFFVTEGGVISPGGVILDLVPSKDSLILEARLKESDIGFVKPGQSAIVKLSSSDAVNFGQINGKVMRISPDTETDEDDNRIVFYKTLIELEQNYFEGNEKFYVLVPGVKVTASIQIGERTLANYLLSPFIDSLGQSFQER
tara:strand:+ start:1 stop:1104 length:1104 start_codon:yes stop_codon:yes gene_type:complete